jgi:hypothetical protein
MMLLLSGGAVQRASAKRRGLCSHVCVCCPALMCGSLNEWLRYCCWRSAAVYRHAWPPVAKAALSGVRCYLLLASQAAKTPELAANDSCVLHQGASGSQIGGRASCRACCSGPKTEATQVHHVLKGTCVSSHSFYSI